MESTPLTRGIINAILPITTNGELLQANALALEEIENDMLCLMDWLEPFYPTDSDAVVADPNPRVKAAIKSCIREEAQLEFVAIYVSSIRKQFDQHFKPLVLSLTDVDSFINIVGIIRRIHVYYRQYVDYLGLGLLAHDLFQRNLHSLFRMFLTQDQRSQFLVLLRQYLGESLFTRMDYTTSRLQEIMKTLIGIDFVYELNYYVIELSIERIQSFVSSTCRGVWDRPVLKEINDWIRSELYPSFDIIIRLLSTEFNQSYLTKLIKIGHDELVSLRIKEVFSLVTNHPATKIALEELHECLLIGVTPHKPIDTGVSPHIRFQSELGKGSSVQAHQRSKLVDNFIQACHDNLLHSGVNTVDIIIAYTSTIKSFLIIDPKGVLLDKVARPIRRYLKGRDDVIIKLVHGFLNDDQANELVELAQELQKSVTSEDVSMANSTGHSTRSKNGDVDVEDLLDLHWVPDPIDALPDFKKGRVSDIIESLISIFDLNEVFVDEITKLFGNRLIGHHDHNLNDIVKQLSMLKARFGKNGFTTLDVMIRDIESSRHINTQVAAEPWFRTTILSHLYWLSVNLNDTELDDSSTPSEVQKAFSSFNDGFKLLKKGRYLKPLPGVGLAKLEIETTGGKKTYEVSLDKASVVTVFSGKTTALTADDIASQLLITPYSASKALEYWVKENVLTQTTDGFIASE